jgi:hypothetical protein
MVPTRNRNSGSQVWASTRHPPNVTAKAIMAGSTRRIVTPSGRASAIARSIQLTMDSGVISNDSQPRGGSAVQWLMH